jgi:amidase
LFPFDARLDWPKSIAGRAMDTYHRWMEAVVPATLAGLPALSVPAGFNNEGLPIGLQIIGPPRSDRAVLEVGCAYQHASNYHARLSPLLGSESGIANVLASE